MNKLIAAYNSGNYIEAKRRAQKYTRQAIYEALRINGKPKDTANKILDFLYNKISEQEIRRIDVFGTEMSLHGDCAQNAYNVVQNTIKRFS